MSGNGLVKIKSISPQFLVKDINHSILFYTKCLGFESSFLYEDFYCGLVKDGCSLHLKTGKPVMEERENRKTNEHADIIVSVENIGDLYQELNGKAPILQPLREMPYGKEFYIADPDG